MPHGCYEVLARRSRPSSWQDLFGHEHIVRTITNSISNNRSAHAYLFTGARGNGKTTIARILAKMFNCSDISADYSPCNRCNSCIAIDNDKHLDVIEIDAASKNGIEDIKAITENVRYAPVDAKYKVIIIDEIHMLSKYGFNALLKTLEEPPRHVKFIMATTEINKIPATIVSRCQRFNLPLFPDEKITTYLRQIADKDELNYEISALRVIAEAAQGSLRDGLSILEQVVNYCDGNVINDVGVRELLGIPNKNRVYEILYNIVIGNIPEAVAAWNEIYEQNMDSFQFIQNMQSAINMIAKINSKVVSSCPESLSSDCIEIVMKIAKIASIPDLTRLWQISIKAMEELKNSVYPKMAMEMILIRMGYCSHILTLAEMEQHEQNNGKNQSSSDRQSNISSKDTCSKKNVNDSVNMSSNNLTARDIVKMCNEYGEISLVELLCHHTKIISCQDNNLVLKAMKSDEDHASCIAKLCNFLFSKTNILWHITVSNSDKEMSHNCSIVVNNIQKSDDDAPILNYALDLFPDSIVE